MSTTATSGRSISSPVRTLSWVRSWRSTSDAFASEDHCPTLPCSCLIVWLGFAPLPAWDAKPHLEVACYFLKEAQGGRTLRLSRPAGAPPCLLPRASA